MWSKYKLRDLAISTFVDFCNQIGEQGLLEDRGEKYQYLTIAAPDGGKRSYQLNTENLEALMVGDEGYDMFLIKREIMTDLVYCPTMYGTSGVELTERDRKYFSDVELRLLKINISEGAY